METNSNSTPAPAVLGFSHCLFGAWVQPLVYHEATVSHALPLSSLKPRRFYTDEARLGTVAVAGARRRSHQLELRVVSPRRKDLASLVVHEAEPGVLCIRRTVVVADALPGLIPFIWLPSAHRARPS